MTEYLNRNVKFEPGLDLHMHWKLWQQEEEINPVDIVNVLRNPHAYIFPLAVADDFMAWYKHADSAMFRYNPYTLAADAVLVMINLVKIIKPGLRLQHDIQLVYLYNTLCNPTSPYFSYLCEVFYMIGNDSVFREKYPWLTIEQMTLLALLYTKKREKCIYSTKNHLECIPEVKALAGRKIDLGFDTNIEALTQLFLYKKTIRGFSIPPSVLDALRKSFVLDNTGLIRMPHLDPKFDELYLKH